MKFGIWVEPERVDLQTVGKAGLAKRAVAGDPVRPLRSRRRPTRRARLGSTLPGQPEARDWILGRLSALIDAAHPDYLKWDNNFWVNCTRSGHGHGSDDGNFTHVVGAAAAARDVARPLSRPADRELLRRRQPPRAEHAGVLRHGLDGRPVLVGAARPAQPRGAQHPHAAVDAAVVRLRQRMGGDGDPTIFRWPSGAGCPASSARPGGATN